MNKEENPISAIKAMMHRLINHCFQVARFEFQAGKR